MTKENPTFLLHASLFSELLVMSQRASLPLLCQTLSAGVFVPPPASGFEESNNFVLLQWALNRGLHALIPGDLRLTFILVIRPPKMFHTILSPF